MDQITVTIMRFRHVGLEVRDISLLGEEDLWGDEEGEAEGCDVA